MYPSSCPWSNLTDSGPCYDAHVSLVSCRLSCSPIVIAEPHEAPMYECTVIPAALISCLSSSTSNNRDCDVSLVTLYRRRRVSPHQQMKIKWVGHVSSCMTVRITNNEFYACHWIGSLASPITSDVRHGNANVGKDIGLISMYGDNGQPSISFQDAQDF